MNKIDLSKNQLVEGDVLVEVWNNEYQKENRYLHSVDHGLLFPFVCFQDGTKRSDLKKDYNLYCWKNAKIIETKYKVKDFYPLVEVLKEEGFQLDNKRLSSEKEDICFSVNMFKYCGEYVTADELNGFKSLDNNYHFMKTWLEEVNE